MRVEAHGPVRQAAPMSGVGINAVEVGRRLRATRRALGFKRQSEIADLLGCNRSNWVAYEKGDRVLPPRFALELLHRYGVTLDFIYAGREDALPTDLRGRINAALARNT